MGVQSLLDDMAVQTKQNWRLMNDRVENLVELKEKTILRSILKGKLPTLVAIKTYETEPFSPYSGFTLGTPVFTHSYFCQAPNYPLQNVGS